jgi:hypothetical protein
VKDQSEDQPSFASGGVMPARDASDDSVPAMLDNGYVIPKGRPIGDMFTTASDPDALAAANQPDVEVSVEPQAEVRFVSDGDSGAAGESSGG